MTAAVPAKLSLSSQPHHDATYAPRGEDWRSSRTERPPRDPPQSKEQTALSHVSTALAVHTAIPPQQKRARKLSELQNTLLPLSPLLCSPCVGTSSALHGNAAREPAPPVDGIFNEDTGLFAFHVVP